LFQGQDILRPDTQGQPAELF